MQNYLSIGSRTTSAPSRSALADRWVLPVLLITRLSKADKTNRRGRSLSICRGQWTAGIETRHWNILGDSNEILKGIFEKQKQFSKNIVFAKFDRQSVVSINHTSSLQFPKRSKVDYFCRRAVPTDVRGVSVTDGGPLNRASKTRPMPYFYLRCLFTEHGSHYNCSLFPRVTSIESRPQILSSPLTRVRSRRLILSTLSYNPRWCSHWVRISWSYLSFDTQHM